MVIFDRCQLQRLRPWVHYSVSLELMVSISRHLVDLLSLIIIIMHFLDVGISKVSTRQIFDTLSIVYCESCIPWIVNIYWTLILSCTVLSVIDLHLSMILIFLKIQWRYDVFDSTFSHRMMSRVFFISISSSHQDTCKFSSSWPSSTKSEQETQDTNPSQNDSLIVVCYAFSIIYSHSLSCRKDLLIFTRTLSSARLFCDVVFTVARTQSDPSSLTDVHDRIRYR